MNKSDDIYNNLTSSPLSTQSWIVENISSLISSNHDDDFSCNTSEANLSNDCTLTPKDEDNHKLNTPPTLHFTATNTTSNTSASQLNDEQIETRRAFEHQSPNYYNPNGSVNIVNSHYSPAETMMQHDFNMNAAYNQLLQQKQQYLFNNIGSNELNYYDANSFQQLNQPQLEQRPKQMRNSLSTSDTYKHIDQNIRLPISSSSYSLNNYYHHYDDSGDEYQQNFANHSYNHLHSSISSSALNSYCLNNNNNDSDNYEELNSSKKKKLTNYSMSSSAIGGGQQQHAPQTSSYSSNQLSATNNSSFAFSNSTGFYDNNYSAVASLNASAQVNNNKPSSFLNNNKCLVKSLSGTQILSNKTNTLNNKINEYGLYNNNNNEDNNNGFLNYVSKNTSYYNNSNYYGFNNGLDVSNSSHEDNISNNSSTSSNNSNHLKQSQSNYSFNNNNNNNNGIGSSKARIIKSSTTCFNKENNVYNNDNQYQTNTPYFVAQSTSYDNMRAINKQSLTKEKNVLTQQYLNANSATNSLSNSFNQSNKPACQLPSSSSSNNHIELHVRNLDYKISADEWKRILLENFRKHCKEIISVNVITNADKSLLGVVKLATKEDARLAISCLHHKKIGYKRLNVNIAFSVNNNSPKSKIVAILKNNDSNEMALTKFMELYELRYNQTITVSELFKLKDIVYIAPSKDGQGRQIKLTGRNYQNNLENEMQDLLLTPYCSLHSQKQDVNGSKEMNTNGWLPNVIVSLRTFKSAVHKLLNDHGGQMPLLSFMDCYKCCIFNDSTNNNNINNLVYSNHRSNSHVKDLSYQLIIDNENGVSLEHLITCAQDVQIQLNEGFYKQLQWENDKSKPHFLQSRNSMNKQKSTSMSSLELNPSHFSSATAADQFVDYNNENNLLDETLDESQRKINQFTHEIVELFKNVPRCIIPLSKFNHEYHKKYGKQCRVADYGFTKLYDLLESIPHVLQILDSEYEKKLTLSHRIQVRRFSTDLIKVLKSYNSKQMFADDYPLTYEKHFGKKFDIKDYGVCFLEDMLAELPESIICRKEIEGRTFIQIPKVIQMDEERLCTYRLVFDIIDMLKHKPRFSIQFIKFIPNFHHHFGRQCKLSNYGFTKLVDLLEAISDTVQVLVKDCLQFIQLKPHIMLDLICSNLAKYLDENNYKLKCTLNKLEEIYNSKYEPICYQDFDCENFTQLFTRLPFKTNFISVKPFNPIYDQLNLDSIEWLIEIEMLNEKSTKRVAKLMLKKLMDDSEEFLISLIKEKEKNFKLKSKQYVCFNDLFEMLVNKNSEICNTVTTFNSRSISYINKCLNEYFIYSNNNNNNEINNENNYDQLHIIGLSDIYWFAKQIRNIFKSSNQIDMTMPELESFYKKMFLSKGVGLTKSLSVNEQLLLQQQQQPAQLNSVLPFKRLGYIDSRLLFSQGLNLLVTIKKFTDKRICLNKEFWPKSFIETSTSALNESLNSSSSPINDTDSNKCSEKSMTPLSHRLSGSSETYNSSRRNIFGSNLLTESFNQ